MSANIKLQINPQAIPKSLSVTYQWGNTEVDYASDVYFGRTDLMGTPAVLSRPWVEPVVERVNFEASFAAAYFDNNGNIKAAFSQLASDLVDEFSDVIDNYDWGVIGNNLKQFRDEPTWQTITDSGDLRDSLQVSEVRES